MVWANADRFGGAISLRRRAHGSWVDVTTREFAAQVREVAKSLLAARLQPGDRIVVPTGPRYETLVLDFAIWAAGGQVVPVAETDSDADVERALTESGARAVIATTTRRAVFTETVDPVLDRLSPAPPVWRLDHAPGRSPTISAPAGIEGPVNGPVDGPVAGGADRIDDETVHQRRLAVHTGDIATVRYPAGGGDPIRHTHGELLTSVRTAIAELPHLLRAGGSVLVVLPPTDPVARIITLACVYTRTTLGWVGHSADLLADVGLFRPTTIVGTPGLLREFRDTARHRAHADGRAGAFTAAEAVATEYGATRDGHPVPLSVRVKHAVADRLVYPKLRASFGGRCVAAITSGPPLTSDDADDTSFYRGIGITVHDAAALGGTAGR